MKDVLGNWLNQQFGPVEMIRLGFLHGFAENPAATLGVIALTLFVLAILVRYSIYFGIRLTGQSILTRSHDAMETLCLWGAFAVGFLHGQPFSIGVVTVRNGKIVELDFLADQERLREYDLTILDD